MKLLTDSGSSVTTHLAVLVASSRENSIAVSFKPSRADTVQHLKKDAVSVLASHLVKSFPDAKLASAESVVVYDNSGNSMDDSQKLSQRNGPFSVVIPTLPQEEAGPLSRVVVFQPEKLTPLTKSAQATDRSPARDMKPLIDQVKKIQNLDKENKVLVKQNEELTDQSEALAKQNEKLAVQNEALTKQNKELAKQNEELTKRNEEVAKQNEALRNKSEALTLAYEKAKQDHTTVCKLQDAPEKNEEGLTQAPNTPEGDCVRICKLEEEQEKAEKVIGDLSREVDSLRVGQEDILAWIFQRDPNYMNWARARLLADNCAHPEF
ncbi:hypothetical protein D9757_006046 [Collybiopsis confluens]|uniref:Uncharacterized protein n=1 Tax=Collybiopsis confluens TaxID=2823264 RepID=A0A8H5HUT8_9AGAR|nr:hypothetical protein D9757_006046 [Collybiopsis confluens]